MWNICNSMRNYLFLITRGLPLWPRYAVDMLGTGRTRIGVELAEVCPALWGQFRHFWGHSRHLWGHSRLFGAILGIFGAIPGWNATRGSIKMCPDVNADAGCRPLPCLWSHSGIPELHSVIITALSICCPSWELPFYPQKCRKFPERGEMQRVLLWAHLILQLSFSMPWTRMSRSCYRIEKLFEKEKKIKKQSSFLPLFIYLPRSSHCSLGYGQGFFMWIIGKNTFYPLQISVNNWYNMSFTALGEKKSI